MYDFVAIGDITTDDFIRLEDESFVLSEDAKGRKLTMPFGEKLPFTSSTVLHAVGNAPNAAVSATKLGLKTAHVGSVGSDTNGEKTIEYFNKVGVDTKFVDTQSGKSTNYSYVLWVGDDRTILRKHEEFSYSLPELEAKWVYFSSVSKNASKFRDDLAEYLENNPETKFVLQPGSNEIKLGAKGIERLYKRADAYFSNVGEAGDVLDIETLGVKELLKRVYALGPKIVVITDGPRGAYAYDGEKMYFVTPYPDPKPPLERTGAGDSFSSTTAIALSLGHDLPTALKWGAVNSMSVVQHIGAHDGLLTKEEIEKYLSTAPKEFECKELTD